MGNLVCGGALLKCSMGVSPAPLNILPTRRALVSGRPVATILDNVPLVNISPFGMCLSLANPAVAAATAAALGVLTPMPCNPVIPAPWLPTAPTTLVGGAPALTNASTCQCAYGGIISILMAGQLTTTA